MTVLSRALDDEFKRVVRDENTTFEKLVAEVASDTNYTTRMIYFYRSGKEPLPAELIPYFVMRFKSRALLNALITLCEKVPVEVPKSYDLARLSTAAIRDTFSHYENVLRAFDDDDITTVEMKELETTGARVKQVVTMFEEIVRAAYARSQEQKAVKMTWE